MDEATLELIRQGFRDDGDDLIGFRRLTEPVSASRVRTSGWEFIGHKSILTVNREGETTRASVVRPLDKFPDELTSDAYTGITNADRRIPDHPLIGTERVYREFQSRHVPDGNRNGIVVLGNGMTVYVTDAFYDWNGVPGLDMLHVNVAETRCRTHVTPADVGWSGPLLT